MTYDHVCTAFNSIKFEADEWHVRSRIATACNLIWWRARTTTDGGGGGGSVRESLNTIILDSVSALSRPGAFDSSSWMARSQSWFHSRALHFVRSSRADCLRSLINANGVSEPDDQARHFSHVVPVSALSARATGRPQAGVTLLPPSSERRHARWRRQRRPLPSTKHLARDPR
jgi:hypothetical protein